MLLGNDRDIGQPCLQVNSFIGSFLQHHEDANILNIEMAVLYNME